MTICFESSLFHWSLSIKCGIECLFGVHAGWSDMLGNNARGWAILTAMHLKEAFELLSALTELDLVPGEREISFIIVFC